MSIMKKIEKYIGYRPTWAEVNLNNLQHNFRQIKKMLRKGTKVMVCVKADAYGHGLTAVSKKLISSGLDYLGVASVDEGILLRREKIKIPILILGLMLKEDIEPLFTYGLTPTICSDDFADALNKAGRRKKKVIKVHIKVDTGMGRLGILPEDAFEFIKKIHKLKFLDIEGVFTHIACADIDKAFTLYQLKIFRDLIARLERTGIHIPLMHAANSLGVINYRESHFNMVRPGLVIYGLHPKEGLDIKLRPVLALKTKVVYCKKVPAQYGISYGHTYITKKKTTIATLPIGYGDGYPRNLSNRAPVLIGGRRFHISGRVCMDQVMVDVGNFPIKIGDEVILIGSQGKKRISAEELAQLAGTIPYEIVCGLASRIPRIYI